MTDLRRGRDSLAARVQQKQAEGPFGGQYSCFADGRVIWSNGCGGMEDGSCLFLKRLERGRFVWPRVLEQQDPLAAREAEILHLKLLMVELRRMQLGRRSERMTERIGPLELSLEALEETRAERSVPPAPDPGAEAVPRPHRPALPVLAPGQGQTRTGRL